MIHLQIFRALTSIGLILFFAAAGALATGLINVSDIYYYITFFLGIIFLLLTESISEEIGKLK